MQQTETVNETNRQSGTFSWWLKGTIAHTQNALVLLKLKFILVRASIPYSPDNNPSYLVMTGHAAPFRRAVKFLIKSSHKLLCCSAVTTSSRSNATEIPLALVHGAGLSS